MALSPTSCSFSSSSLTAPEVPLRKQMEVSERLQECQEQLKELKQRLNEKLKQCQQGCINALRNTFDQKRTKDSSSSHCVDEKKSGILTLTEQGRLDGVSGRVTALSWQHNSGFYSMNDHTQDDDDDPSVLAAYQTGKLLIFKAQSSKVRYLIKCAAWNQSCDYIEQGLIASGGLDNLVSVHRLPKEGGLLESWRDFGADNKRELIQHEAYVSGVRFMNKSNGSKLVSVSGDATLMLWDVPMSNPLCVWKEHLADVLSLDLHPSHPNLVVSGAADKSAKVWDLRQKHGSVFTMKGHDNDVNSVRWFPDCQSFLTGSEDATMRLVDLRSLSTVAEFGKSEGLVESVDSVEVSHSGRFLFGASETEVMVWDTLSADMVGCLRHPSRVNAIQMSPDGRALATGAWDSQVRLWAQ